MADTSSNIALPVGYKPGGGAEMAPPPEVILGAKKRKNINMGDLVFQGSTAFFAFLVFALVFLMAYEMFRGSALSIDKFGWSFLTRTIWDPVQEEYGALVFIFGTVVSSMFALVIALPLSIGVAVFLSELAPQMAREAGLVSY